MRFTYKDLLELKDVSKEGLHPSEVAAVTRIQMYVRNQSCSPKTYAIIEVVRAHLNYNLVGLADLVRMAPQIEQLIHVPDHSRKP
jgi:hypothetical protein